MTTDPTCIACTNTIATYQSRGTYVLNYNLTRPCILGTDIAIVV